MKKPKLLKEAEEMLGIEFSDISWIGRSRTLVAKDIKITKRKKILTSVKIKDGNRTIKIESLKNERI
jgi:hypothetical protein